MKTNEKYPVIARFTRWGLVPAGLLVAALCFAGPSRAQSSATPATTAGGMRRAKGKNEHVKVNGYWKIEVHDPAGKLVSHTEFENSLTTNDPNGYSGDFALAEILGGSNSQMVVTDPKTGSNVDLIATGYATGSVPGFLANLRPLAQNGAPFKSAVFILPFLSIGLNTSPQLSASATPAQGFQDGAVTPSAAGPCANAAATPPAFGCLVPTSQALNTSGATGNTASTTGNQIVLTSSFLVGASTTISQVGTYITPMRLTIISGGASFAYAASDPVDGTTLNGPAAYSLTSATLSTAPGCVPTPTAPCAVSMTADQTISVTVTLSFQ